MVPGAEPGITPDSFNRGLKVKFPGSASMADDSTAYSPLGLVAGLTRASTRRRV